MTDRPTLRWARGALFLIAAACLGYWTWATADALVYRHVEERRLEQAIDERAAQRAAAPLAEAVEPHARSGEGAAASATGGGPLTRSGEGAATAGGPLTRGGEVAAAATNRNGPAAGTRTAEGRATTETTAGRAPTAPETVSTTRERSAAASRRVDGPSGGASSATGGRSAASTSALAAGERAARGRAGGSSAASAPRGAPPAAPAPTVLGRLEIPRIGLSTLVARDSDRRSLRRAAGHVAGTALPGEGDNVGVAGHRDTVFRELRRVEAGDRVTLTTPDGTHRYAVESLRVVPPDAVEVLAPTDGETLTLVTCYPFGTFGPAPDRFVVRARLLGTV